ncbi:MAG TPA: hypothetical protein VI454_06900 [Verrucomicrobiae bacterium]|jgi:Spy/CpxP family protein refolding chaperone
MKYFGQTLALGGAMLALAVSAPHVNAQAEPKTDGGEKKGTTPGRGRGGFDPEAMRQRMNERMREAFDVKNDDEWKLISERVEKVTEARRGTGGGFGGGFAFRGGPPGGGTPDAGGGTRTSRTSRGPEGGNPEAEELQKALEAKAPNDEIKAKLAKLREARKANEVKLEKAQADLREVLSVRQEAVAVMFGLLK